MNELWQAAWPYFWREEMPYVLGMAAAFAALTWRLSVQDRRSVAYTAGFFLLCVVGQFGAAAMHAQGLRTGAAGAHELFLVGSGLTLIRLSGLFVFRVLMPRVGLRAPRIAEDILVVLAYAAFGLVRLRVAGVDLSGIVATSAVITAVIAFSMQETLGNILGGLALQSDRSIQLGDWVRIDDVAGRVTEVRWRYTAVETRNGEIVVVPNSLLMKSKFAIVGRPGPEAQAWRRPVWFNVDYSVPPARVIDTVEQSLASAEIPNVAGAPAPNCVLMEFGANYARYALRYWLTDPRLDDPTDSTVRLHVLAALQRAGMRMAEPEYTVHMVAENVEYREQVHAREQARRLSALRGVEIFASFTEDELKSLAERLVYAPFARGDVITRQGMVAHWLYILVAGEADVWLEQGGERRLLARLPAGSVFGEMGLLTGEPRRATVIAAADAQCYRLDKVGFQDIIRSRPAIAGEMSAILAERETQIEHAMREIGAEARAKEMSRQHANILGRIQAFFGLAQ